MSELKGRLQADKEEEEKSARPDENAAARRLEDSGKRNSLIGEKHIIPDQHMHSYSRSPILQLPAGDIDTHQIDNNTITRQITRHTRNTSTSSTFSNPSGKLVLYIPPTPNPDGKVSSPTSSGIITPWLKRQHRRFSSHYHRHSPKSPLWFRAITCFIPLDHFAKLILTLGLTQAAMGLLWGSSVFIQQRGFDPSTLRILTPAIQIACGVFYSAVSVFGMSVMWGGFRKSPTAALCFMILNCLTSVTLITTCVMWFYFSWRWKEAREDRCYEMTVPAGKGLNAPMRPAPPWAIDECLRESSIASLWMAVWGSVHGAMFYFSIILSVWAWRYRNLVKKFALRDQGVGGNLRSGGVLGKHMGDLYVSLNEARTGVAAMNNSRAHTPEDVLTRQVASLSPPGTQEAVQNSPTSIYSPPLMSSVSRASQFFPEITTIRDSLGTIESDRHKSTIIIGNAIFRLAPPKSSPSLSSPRTTATSPRSPPVSARSAESTASTSISSTFPNTPPPPKSPLPCVPTIRTIDASMTGAVLQTPIVSPGYPPTPTINITPGPSITTTLDSSITTPQPQPSTPTRPSTGVLLSYGEFEFPNAPTGPVNKPKRNISPPANTRTIVFPTPPQPSTISNGIPPVPPLPPSLPEKNPNRSIGDNAAAAASAAISTTATLPTQQQQQGGAVRGRMNRFPIVPVKRGTGTLSVGLAPELLSSGKE